MTKYKIKCKCAIVDDSPKEKKKQCMATSLLNFSEYHGSKHDDKIVMITESEDNELTP